MLRWFLQGDRVIRLGMLVSSTVGLMASAIGVYQSHGHPILDFIFSLWLITILSMFWWAWTDHQDNEASRQRVHDALHRKNSQRVNLHE